MAGIDFTAIPASWKDCTGYSSRFPSEEIEAYVPLPFSGFTTKNWAPFVSPRLKEALFHEIQHYIDRSLYHLIVGKWMVCEGRTSWGLVSYYYSTFFAAQAAIRLKGIFFVKVTYDSETNVPPTHRLEVINLIGNQYRIQRSTSRGEHKRVWNAFFDSFGSIWGRPAWARYAPVTSETDPEERLVEMHRRHLVNYVPGHGYLELGSPKEAEALRQELSVNSFDDLVASLSHRDQQLEVRAYLRLRLCLQLLNDIARKGGVYQIHHPGITDRRRQWITKFGCPLTLSSHIENALAS